MKKDNPRITVRPDDKLFQRFRRKCFNLGVSQDSIIIQLIKKWTKENNAK